MGGGKRLNAVLRKSASAALFPILRDLGIQAALTHKGALALHLNTTKAAKEIKVVVKHEGEITLEGICAAVVSRRSRARASANGYFTRNKEEHGHHLKFFSADPQAEGKNCRVIFIQSGGSLPTILEDFSEIVYISDSEDPVLPVPVLPVHAILLEQLIARSRLTVVKKLGKSVAKFMNECLLACDSTPLQQRSPLWRSLDILDQIAQHVQVLPGAKAHWIACGIDPSVFTSTTLWPSHDIPDEAVRDVDSDDGDSDLGALEGPSAVVQELNVVPEEPDHGNWHGAVTGAAARHVVDILKGFGIECAVVGSAASQLYSHGETRAPEQLDILVLQNYVSLTPSLLKQSLFQRDPGQFEWKNEILHFFSFPSSRSQAKLKCKVEILLSGTTDLPNLASSDVIWIDKLPVVPFLTLLLFKLQAWGNDSSPAKARDVVDLLLLVPNLPVIVFRPWTERKRMSSKFQRESEARVKRFCSRSNFPEAKPTWEMLGFDVESD